jgi:hypothetical protein
MALDKTDFNDLTKAMSKAFADAMAGKGGNTSSASSAWGGGARNRNDSAKAQDELFVQVSAHAKIMKELNEKSKKLSNMTDKQIKETQDGQDTLVEYNKTIKKSTEYYDSLGEEINKLSRLGFHGQSVALKELTKATGNFQDTLTQTQRNSSLLSASLLETHKGFEKGSAHYKDYISQLSNSVKGLTQNNKSILSSTGLMDKYTGELRRNLSPEDFSKLRMKLGEAQGIISESGKTPEGQRNALLQLSAAGFDLGESFEGITKNGEVTADGLKKLARISDIQLGTALGKLSTDADNAALGLDKVAHGATDSIFNKAGRAITGSSLQDKLMAAGETAAVLAALSKVKEVAIVAAKEIGDFNVQHIPASFMQVKSQAIAMGMSFEETTKFLKENQQTMALYGAAGFSQLTNQLGSTFKHFGFTAAQSASMIGPAIAEAASAGVDVQNQSKLNDYVSKSMTGFQKLQGILGITATEFIKLNGDLLSNQDITNTMMGLGKEQAGMYFEGLKAQREDLVMKGISIEQAQEMIKTQEAAKHMDVKSRNESAAKVAMQMQMQGRSPADSMRAMQIMQLGRNASQADSAWLNKTLGEVGIAAQKSIGAQGQNVAGTQMMEMLTSNLHGIGAYGAQEDQGSVTEKAARANLGYTPEQAAAAAKAAQPNAMVADAADAINKVSSFMSNSFLGGLSAASVALLGLAVQASAAGLSLGGKGGGIVNGIKGLFGKGGGAVAGAGESVIAAEASQVASKGAGALGLLKGAGSMAGKVLGRAAVPLAIVGSLYEGYEGYSTAADKEASGEITHRQANKAKGGALGGALGGGLGAWGGMAAGAALGSVVPIVGTVIGGLIGAGLGAWGGSALGNVSGEAAAGALSGPDEATVTAAGQTTTTDIKAHEYLSDINDNMIQLVSLMQQVVVNTGTEQVSNRTPPAPGTVNNYIKGGSK